VIGDPEGASRRPSPQSMPSTDLVADRARRRADPESTPVNIAGRCSACPFAVKKPVRHRGHCDARRLEDQISTGRRPAEARGAQARAAGAILVGRPQHRASTPTTSPARTRNYGPSRPNPHDITRMTGGSRAARARGGVGEVPLGAGLRYNGSIPRASSLCGPFRAEADLMDASAARVISLR